MEGQKEKSFPILKKSSTKSFRSWITVDGSSGYKAEAGRYHLYVSLACPWAHKTLIVRNLKGLGDGIITVTIVDWTMDENGWSFDAGTKAGCTMDINGATHLKDIYTMADKDFDGDCTVPVLWDKASKTIVNNDSTDILRMFNSSFNEFSMTKDQRQLDLYPEGIRREIDDLNGWISTHINHGVYRAGCAHSQADYDVAVTEVFEALDRAEGILSTKRFVAGDHLTEADIGLFVTLVRFDTVYVGHFKCNRKRIVDYPHLWAHTRDIYQMDGVSKTVNQEHIKKHYQTNQKEINPSGIVAVGPELNFNAPHSRDKL